ncbi:MAG: 50S ribosomal protein L3 [bacterium]|nr:50S ribosomal protein L3 [bacterium]
MKIHRMGILGRKMGMTQIFDDEGRVIPVTVIQAGPCTVVQVKTPDACGYGAVQLGFDEGKETSFTKPLRGHFARAKTPPFKFLREIRLPAADLAAYAVGQAVGADIFSPGEFVDVTGVSKGKGYAGVIKRHHFSGSPASHGSHEYFRHGGSIGQHSYPGRVFKGLGMAGHLGAARATVQNLKVVKVTPGKNLLLIRGAVPGPTGAYVVVRKAVKRTRAVPA